MSITVPLPNDSLGYRFAGVAGRLQGGVQQASSEYATADVRLMASDGQTPLLTVPVSGTGIHVAATAVNCDGGTNDEQAVAAATGLRLVGFSCYETTGSVGGSFWLHHGTSTAGPLLYAVNLGANESRGEWFGESGIAAPNGIYLNRTGGDVLVIVYYKAVA